MEIYVMRNPDRIRALEAVAARPTRRGDRFIATIAVTSMPAATHPLELADQEVAPQPGALLDSPTAPPARA